MKQQLLLLLCAIFFPAFVFAGYTKKDPVKGDPIDAHIYTLDNGLTVYLSVNKDEPRVQTYIAVRAGSKYDPAETTGLAHYLEHMLFKGTSVIGTINWEEEKKVLKQISDLYEDHKDAKSPDMKAEIYKQIDSLSYLASSYAVPNEYDKMVSMLGARGTNAFTSNDQTVYVNNIPSNELERWLMLESERFRELVLRLFHTELETVYEEFNINQDRDGRWSYQATWEGMYPNHPYGTQSTIGLGEHLKSPSMVNIHDYFDTYYRPNNVAVCIAGDLDPEATIKMVDKYFGDWEQAEIPEFREQGSKNYEYPLEREIVGKQAEHVYIGFPYGGAGTEDALYLTLIDEMMSNGSAGLIDININKKQLMLGGSSFRDIKKDYSAHMFYGTPKEGQSLEEVRDLLLGQIEVLKNGEFDEWLVEATINKLKLDRMRRFESNGGRAFAFVDAFIEEKNWADFINEMEAMDKISKKDIVAFANEKYGDNYVVTYKRKGDPDRHKVEKPSITPVIVNRDTASEFMQYFRRVSSEDVEPRFVDFDNAIEESTWSDKVTISFIENEKNDRFELYYIFDMGSDHDLMLAEGIRLLTFLGTDKYSPEEFQKELFKFGLSLDVSASDDYVYVSLGGLEENMDKGVELLEHLLNNVKGDADAYQSLVARTSKSREDAKSDKGTILRRALYNYGLYGPESPYQHRLSIEEMEAIDVQELEKKIKMLPNFEHRVFYYGTKGLDHLSKLLDKHHELPEAWAAIPEKAEFEQLETTKNQVYFVHFDMVQAEMMIITRDEQFNPDLMGNAYLFNSYFGSGLSSIVFQEIREQKALAYSAYAYFSSPSEKDQHHYARAYVGTQADKLEQAADAILELINDMPYVPAQFEASRQAALKNIATDWTTGSSIYWSRERARDRGLDYDIRKDIYDAIGEIDFDAMEAFFQEHIADRPRTFLVLGHRDQVDMEVLEGLGEVKELTLEEIFGY